MINWVNSNLNKIFTTLFSIIILAHYWWPLVSNIAIMFCFLLLLLHSSGREGIKEAFLNKWFWVLSTPFWLGVIGLAYTEDLSLGMFMIEKRLSLMAFPLLFLSVRKWGYNRETILSTTILGGVSVLIGCITQSTYLFLTGYGGTELFYSDLLAYPFFGQAVYLAFMINVWFVLIGYQLLMKEGIFHKIKWLKYIVIPFLLVVHFLLASRMSMLVLILAFVGFISIWGIKRMGVLKSILMIGSFAGLAFLLTIIFPKSLNRFRNLGNFEYNYENKNPLNHFNAKNNAENWTGITARLAIWNSVIEDLGELPVVGHGVGDVEKQLLSGYQKRNFHLALENNFNTHNQYLDYLLSSGYLGLILLIGAFIVTLIYSLKNGNYLYAIFFTIVLITMMTENILNRNMGIVFFALLNALLFFKKEKNKVVDYSSKS